MSFNDLPTEMLLNIGKYANQDLRELSSTCRGFIRQTRLSLLHLVPENNLSALFDSSRMILDLTKMRLPFRDVWSSPIKWNLAQLSKLKTFELEFSMIGEGLIDFLGRHAQTLERITLRYCFTHRKDDWRRLFQLFIDKQPAQLTVFELQAYPVRLWRGQNEQEWQRLEPISGFESLANTREDEMRRFVVADATDDCDKIRPIESLIGSTTDHVDVSEFDESDLIPLWEEVGRLLERNS